MPWSADEESGSAWVGRERELERLGAAIEGARDGRSATITIEGEAGIGKSRLVDALLSAVDTEANVLYGSYPPAGGVGGLSAANALMDRSRLTMLAVGDTGGMDCEFSRFADELGVQLIEIELE